jgi:hypothetical protein
LIVELSSPSAIERSWLPAVRALDPDVVYVQRSSASSRRAIRRQLDKAATTPLEVSEFTANLSFGSGWNPTELIAAIPDVVISASADRIGSPTPLEVAVLGLRTQELADAAGSEVRAPAEIRNAASGLSVVPGSPVASVATGIAGSSLRRPPWWLPFLFHDEQGVEDALALWNLRAVAGAVGHGGLDALRDLVDRTPARFARRIEVLSRQPLPPSASAILATVVASGAQVRLFEEYRWPRRPNRAVVIGANTDVDDSPIVEGTFEIPLRPAAQVRSSSVMGDAAAYVVELDIELPRHGGKRTSMPPRSQLRNLVARGAPAERFPQVLSRLAVQSRVQSDGSTALIARTLRLVKTATLRVPSLTEAMTILAAPVSFALSDKGRYSRWVSARLGGLAGIHRLMTDPRSEVLVREFQLRHDGKRIVGGYRRNMTADDMRAVFTKARAEKRLANRVRGGQTDRQWLELWVESLVAAGFLQLGIRIKCEECRQGSLVTVGNFGETYACPRCGYISPTPAMPVVAYRLAEAAHLFLSQRSDLDALALGALHRRSDAGFSYEFEHDVFWKPGSQNEFDFAAVVDGRIFIGESKTGGGFDESSARVLKRIAKTIKPAAVVVASDAQCAGGCTDECWSNREIWGSSDTSLPTGGGGSPGPREVMNDLRTDLKSQGTRALVLCRGDLYGPFVPDTERMVYF